MEKEIWRSVDLNPRYEVSNFGRVKSSGRSDYKWKKPRILKARPLPKGYLRVQIDGKDQYIHRLVALAFIDNPLKLPFVNHIDADRGNNRVDNLEWCTQQQNLAHAVKIGTMKPQRGDGNHGSKLSSKDVRQIKKLYKPFVITRPMLSKRFGVLVAHRDITTTRFGG